MDEKAKPTRPLDDLEARSEEAVQGGSQQMESRQFNSVSNALKLRTDTAKNSIRNIN